MQNNYGWRATGPGRAFRVAWCNDLSCMNAMRGTWRVPATVGIIFLLLGLILILFPNVLVVLIKVAAFLIGLLFVFIGITALLFAWRVYRFLRPRQ